MVYVKKVILECQVPGYLMFWISESTVIDKLPRVIKIRMRKIRMRKVRMRKISMRKIRMRKI